MPTVLRREVGYLRPVRILVTGQRTDGRRPDRRPTEWRRAIAAAHRALATELVALSDEALRIAVEHVSVRIQFGSPIGSFQSPRHLLADASAVLEGARALLGETWRFGGELSALTAKAAAGRAHRAISDAALQVCGAIGLTIEHNLHRYVTRGFQIDSLCGSYQQLEALLADRSSTTTPWPRCRHRLLGRVEGSTCAATSSTRSTMTSGPLPGVLRARVRAECGEVGTRRQGEPRGLAGCGRARPDRLGVRREVRRPWRQGLPVQPDHLEEMFMTGSVGIGLGVQNDILMPYMHQLTTRNRRNAGCQVHLR